MEITNEYPVEVGDEVLTVTTLGMPVHGTVERLSPWGIAIELIPDTADWPRDAQGEKLALLTVLPWERLAGFHLATSADPEDTRASAYLAALSDVAASRLEDEPEAPSTGGRTSLWGQL